MNPERPEPGSMRQLLHREGKVREALASDKEDIHRIYLDAFTEAEAGEVASLARDLLPGVPRSETFVLVFEWRGDLIGHIAFSRIQYKGMKNGFGSILAPLAVTPKFQKTGIGSVLVREGLRRLKAFGTGRVFVYGDPDYYCQFGFRNELAQRFVPPFPLSQPHGWLGLVIGEPGDGIESAHLECVEALQRPELW